MDANKLQALKGRDTHPRLKTLGWAVGWNELGAVGIVDDISPFQGLMSMLVIQTQAVSLGFVITPLRGFRKQDSGEDWGSNKIRDQPPSLVPRHYPASDIGRLAALGETDFAWIIVDGRRDPSPDLVPRPPSPPGEGKVHRQCKFSLLRGLVNTPAAIRPLSPRRPREIETRSFRLAPSPVPRHYPATDIGRLAALGETDFTWIIVDGRRDSSPDPSADGPLLGHGESSTPWRGKGSS